MCFLEVVISSVRLLGATVPLNICLKSLAEVFGSRHSVDSTEKALFLLIASEILHGDGKHSSDTSGGTTQQTAEQGLCFIRVYFLHSANTMYYASLTRMYVFLRLSC